MCKYNNGYGIMGYMILWCRQPRFPVMDMPVEKKVLAYWELFGVLLHLPERGYHRYWMETVK